MNKIYRRVRIKIVQEHCDRRNSTVGPEWFRSRWPDERAKPYSGPVPLHRRHCVVVVPIIRLSSFRRRFLFFTFFTMHSRITNTVIGLPAVRLRWCIYCLHRYCVLLGKYHRPLLFTGSPLTRGLETTILLPAVPLSAAGMQNNNTIIILFRHDYLRPKARGDASSSVKNFISGTHDVPPRRLQWRSHWTRVCE